MPPSNLGSAEHMPVGAECGGTLTHRYDPQAGAEGMLFMLAAHASGAHRIAGFGSCHNAVGMSAEMMVIQQAYLHAARHIARGIRTDDPSPRHGQPRAGRSGRSVPGRRSDRGADAVR